jgi:hypothetical protein
VKAHGDVSPEPTIYSRLVDPTTAAAGKPNEGGQSLGHARIEAPKDGFPEWRSQRTPSTPSQGF